MTNCIVHIGTHKTGTTTIQDFFSRNRDLLLEQGIDFPEIGRTGKGAQAHRHFSTYMRDLPQEYPGDFADFEFQVRTWTPEAETVVLSSEDFYFGSRANRVGRLKNLMPTMSRVVLILREPASHVLSMFREGARSRLADTLPMFLDTQTAHLINARKGFAYYRYQQNIDTWAAAAPVEVLTYRPDMDLLPEFFDACGLSVDFSGLHEVVSQNLGRSKSDVALAATQLLNRSFRTGIMPKPRHSKLRRMLVAIDESTLTEHLRPYTHQITVPTERFLSAFDSQNPGMIDRFGPRPETVSTLEISPHLLEEVVNIVKALYAEIAQPVLASDPA